MKGCIFLQGNYAKIGHALAYELTQHHGVESFCAYVISDRAKQFVVQQTDLTYTGILVDHEIHDAYVKETIDLPYVKKIEATYGNPTFWKYLYADRRLMYSMDSEAIHTMDINPLYSHDDILRIIQASVRSIERFLEEQKPDFVLIFCIGSVGSSLMYHMAKAKGIRVLVMDSMRIGNLNTFTSDFLTNSGVKELFDRIESGAHQPSLIDEARRILTQFQTNRTLALSYTIDNHKTPPVTWKNRFATYHRIWRQYRREREERQSGYDVAAPPWRVIGLRMLYLWRKWRGYTDLYHTPQWNEEFAFFPLQFEPEVSLLNIAPFHCDQQMVIRMIARSLPLHFKLYVKEHPAMVHRRTRAFYKELLKLPNVRLIDPAVKSIDLIEHAKLVTTVTGTAGWEATLSGKPVISFGHVFYNDYPSVKRCRAMEDLPMIVREQLDSYRYNETQMVHFLAALLENGAIDFSYYQMEYATPAEVLQHPEIKTTATFIMQKLGFSSL